MTKMSKTTAARIRSKEGKQNGGKIEKGSFPARVQRAANKNSKK